MNEKPQARRHRLDLIMGFLWLILVTTGLWAMAKYEFSPGASAPANTRWPDGTQVEHLPDQPTLIMLAHPHCPCTRASIGELEQIMAHCNGRVTAFVLFYKPKGFPPDWEKTDTWRTAAAIPGVSVVCDLDGVEAQKFGGMTSGQTLLYGGDGRLLFRGGITIGRGHAGDNAGRSAIISQITQGAAEYVATPVFGCPIYGTNGLLTKETQACKVKP